MSLQIDPCSPACAEIQAPRGTPLWLKDDVPVEIFELIASHLPRTDLQSLRLVSREFETKISARYFRNVVVPFRAELYDSLSRDENGVLKLSPPSPFSNGMRIFQSFGRHILRFALSLELDEYSLAYPPIKPSQEAVPTFWGIYRWPHKSYHRYADLEDLEQTADETEGMKEALRCLSKVRDLGLCCDAGLGFLCGPEKDARKVNASHPVYATNPVDWMPGPEGPGSESTLPFRPDAGWLESEPVQDSRHPMILSYTKETSQIPSFDNPDSFKRTALREMLSDAGYCESQVDDAVTLLLKTENISFSSFDFDERRRYFRKWEQDMMYHRVGTSFESIDCPAGFDLPLIPVELTRAQKEMLLEMEWAHRAMIQSFVIGLIDNASDGCYSNLSTLTITKIPSCHVNILHRQDFWQKLPSITNVTLGVIADWRRVFKPTPGCVSDISISPVEAVGKVFHLLQNYIGQQKNIQALHFEWICGGEFAPSKSQRNRFVLPAPFFLYPRVTILPACAKEEDTLLSLPFVKHFSLKNCWTSPQAFWQIIRRMALSSLERLELESMSLCGPPSGSPLQSLPQHMFPPWANNVAAAVQANSALMTMFNASSTGPMVAALNGHHAPQPQPFLTPVPPYELRQPEWLSWAGIVEHFSPDVKIRHTLDSESDLSSDLSSESDEPLEEGYEALAPFLPNVKQLPADEESYKIRYLSLKSCGYVCIDTANRDVVNLFHNEAHLVNNSTQHDMWGSPTMQMSRDFLLGKIASFAIPQEEYNMANAFGMRMGWANVYDGKTIMDARTDDIFHPGHGRFTGIIDADNPSREAESPSGQQSDETEA